MRWKLQSWLAKNLGWYSYSGMEMFAPKRWPRGYVRYPDGHTSRAMILGNAWGYARIFKGEVVRTP